MIEEMYLDFQSNVPSRKLSHQSTNNLGWTLDYIIASI